MEIFLKDGESVEELNIKGLKLIQHKDGFKFGTDSVLLAQFANPKPNDKIADFCTGSAIIPILLTARCDNLDITGIEINPQAVDLAQRNVLINSLKENIRIFHGDVSNIDFKAMPKASYDLVVCNPPYTQKGAGIECADEAKNIARFEIRCTLKDIIKNASELLRFGGRFCIVHKPERAAEIIYLCKAFNIEAKQMTLVTANGKTEPSIVLLEGRKNGNTGLRISIKNI